MSNRRQNWDDPTHRCVLQLALEETPTEPDGLSEFREMCSVFARLRGWSWGEYVAATEATAWEARNDLLREINANPRMRAAMETRVAQYEAQQP